MQLFDRRVSWNFVYSTFKCLENEGKTGFPTHPQKFLYNKTKINKFISY